MTSPDIALSTHAVIPFLGLLAVITLSLVILLLARLTRTRLRSPLSEDITRVLDAFPFMTNYWDASLRNQFANRAYAKWFAVDQGLPPGMHMRDLYGDTLFESIRPHVEAALEGRPVIFEQTIPGRSASGPGHFLTQYVPDVINGRVRGFYGFEQDITQINDTQRRLTALLHDNECLLSTLHRHAIVSVADASGRITDANPAFCAISGYARAELLGRDHRIISSGTHSRDFWRLMWHTLASGKPWRGEICNRAKDGSLYWVDSIVAPAFDESGHLVKYISIRHDITAHKDAERRLHESETFLERVQRVSRVGGFTVELASGAQRWTPQTYQIFEVEQGRPLTPELSDSLLTSEARHRLQQANDSARVSGAGYDLVLPMVTATHRSVWLRVSAEIEYANEEPVRLVGAVQDVTKRRKLEEQLRDAINLAQNANHANNECLVT